MAVDYKDYYEILGVSKDADQKAIRSAYRKLARQYHPDVNQSDTTAEEKFKEINEANEVLSDPEKRKRYDEMATYYQQYGQWPGAAGQGADAESGFGSFGGGNYQYYTMNEEDLANLFGGQSPFSDLFGAYFGAGSTGTTRRSRATRGQDVESVVDVTLAEAYQGATRTFELAELDDSTSRLEVKIPAGVDEGASILVASRGLQGTEERGDLYLRVQHIVPDARFTREGTTLRTHVDVPLTTAVLGGEVPVETPDGRRLALHIPADTANGRVFRLRKKGMSQVGKPNKRGDLYAEVHIVLPTHLDEEQRHLFEVFARSIGYDGQATEQ